MSAAALIPNRQRDVHAVEDNDYGTMYSAIPAVPGRDVLNTVSDPESEDEAIDYSNDAAGHRLAFSSQNPTYEQAGVRTIEAISQTWNSWSLFLAYLGLNLLAFTVSLQGQVTMPIQAFATSAFGYHSLLSTVSTFQGIFLSVIKPFAAKLSDVFGRLESFTLSVSLFVIGNIMLASAQNVSTLSAAQLFYAAGSTGLQVLQQIFIADTSDLLNRALFSAIPDLPYLITVWIGPPLASTILENTTWRWGYGIWPIIIPVAFFPLALSLYVNQRKAKKMGLLPPSQFKELSGRQIASRLYYQLDVSGLLLLSAALCLILVPLTIAKETEDGWTTGNILFPLILGCICLVIFPFWERSERLAPCAFFSKELLENKTVLGGCGIALFFFMAFYLSVQPYFYSYLLVVPKQSVSTAGHITQIFSFTATIAAVVVSFLIKFTGHYKYFVTLGAAIYLLGLLLMLKYRTAEARTMTLVATQIIVGIGGGILNIPVQLGVQASVSHDQVAAATAVFLTILEIGGAIGSAISGAIWSNSLPNKLAEYLPSETRHLASVIYGNITLAAHTWPAGSPTQNAIDRAYQETVTTLLIVAVCVSVPLIPLSLMMKNHKLSSMDQKVMGRVIGRRSSTPRVDPSEASDALLADESGSPVETTRLSRRSQLQKKPMHDERRG